MIPFVVIPLLIGAIIQLIKIVVDACMSRRIQIQSLRGAGGFPSVHSGIAASICMMTYVVYGYTSIEFAISFCFSFLFWYDAANVRYQAGQHAVFLKKISHELDHLFPEDYDDDTHKLGLLLKERLGHTVMEVVGGVVIGAILTRLILYYDMHMIDFISMI